MKCSTFSCLLGFASAAVTQTAESSIVFNLSDLPGGGTYAGFSFDEVLTPGSFEGTLTSVSVNATLTANAAYTYANDLCIYIDVPPLSTAGLVQIGGYSNLSAGSRYSWANGNSETIGTTVIDTVTLTTPITFGPTSNSAYSIWIGNGYGASGASGTWTGTVTLNGLTAVTSSVPEPGNLLGLSGLIAAAAFSRGRRGGFKRKPTSSAIV